MGIHAQFVTALANRATIEAEIERLIGILDVADGDPDSEDDDPPGGASEDEGEGVRLLPALPVYGADQSLGPVNEDEAVRAWQAREYGVVRTDRGGWRRP